MVKPKVQPVPSHIPDPSIAFDHLLASDILKLPQPQRFQKVCEALLAFVNQMQVPVFGLPYLLKFMHKINKAELLEGCLRISNFEMWLNALSDLSPAQNLEIRSKICGRYLPREDYQVFFPVSMGKTQWGTHIVTGHSSPDLDTAVASFWSWVDAFAARVGTGMHIWNIPGATLSDQDARVFLEYIGPGIFEHLAKGQEVLMLQAIDLITPHTLTKLTHQARVSQIEPEQFARGVILVDNHGYYLGDWRLTDVESVRLVISMLNNPLRWFESRVHSLLISLFTKPQVTSKQAQELASYIFNLPFYEMEPITDASEKQRHTLDLYLKKIFGVTQGIQDSFESFSLAMSKLHIDGFERFINKLKQLVASPKLFDTKGHLVEDRPELMHHFEECFECLSQAVNALRSYTDTLGIVMRIKHDVLCLHEEHVPSKASVDELQQLIKNHSHLTVIFQEKNGGRVPLGIVYADTLKRKSLGSVSLRDFSNRDEVKISSYLETVSIVDHHKVDIRTLCAPVVLISDTQSCNTLMAEQQMILNDRYSRSYMPREALETKLAELRSKNGLTAVQKKRLQRLLVRKIAGLGSEEFFVDPERERLEYLFYLYAILDDTDLLAKASMRDLVCTVELLNRVHSIEKNDELELINLDDLSKDEESLQKARERILRSGDMYALYSKAYSFKEASLRQQMENCYLGTKNTLFADTKIQNNCARIGQLKFMPELLCSFQEKRTQILAQWLRDCHEVSQTTPHVNLYIQMISTVAGAKDVYENRTSGYNHEDELWFWSSMTSTGIESLISFLRGFRYARELHGLAMKLTLYGPKALTLRTIFEQNFLELPISINNESARYDGAFATLLFKAGKLNSRKAVITPYLPQNHK